MSYCRSNGKDSDVYIVRTGSGLECLGCNLLGGPGVQNWFSTESIRDMIHHLLEHESQGDMVPDRAYARLLREAHGVTKVIK